MRQIEIIKPENQKDGKPDSDTLSDIDRDRERESDTVRYPSWLIKVIQRV